MLCFFSSAHVAHPAMSQLAHDPHSTYSLSALDQGKPYGDHGLPKVNNHIAGLFTGVQFSYKSVIYILKIIHRFV